MQSSSALDANREGAATSGKDFRAAHTAPDNHSEASRYQPARHSQIRTLPGASFSIDGAAPSPGLALLSAVAELRLTGGVSLPAKFDGEFGARSENRAARERCATADRGST
jgi:uncharacterized protein with beta-barrel porin domain